MKKISRFFKAILLFFDRWLITPITKGILSVSDYTRNNGRELEKFINKKQTLIVLSLIFAFIVFFVLDQNANIIMNRRAEILYNQPVVAEFNSEAYVVEGLPTHADITLIGRSADLYLAKQYPSNNVTVDLRGLRPGSHKVPLRYNQRLSSIDYKIDPSTATIVIYEKVSETRELDFDLVHKDKLDRKLVVENVDLSRNDIIIKGAEHRLRQVASVKALVDINNINNPAVGNVTLNDILLVAYDSAGKTVDVEMVPNRISASIRIASPSKEVPIEIVPVGELAFGKSIKDIIPSVPRVTLFGDAEVLNNIESFPITVDVKNLATDKEFNINLKAPSGVRDISIKVINIRITLDDVTTKEFSDIRISHINLDPNLRVGAASAEDSRVAVIVKGSAAAIEALDISTLNATIDLSGYGEGTHEVEVRVTGGDLRLTYESKTKRVRITILRR